MNTTFKPKAAASFGRRQQDDHSPGSRFHRGKSQDAGPDHAQIINFKRQHQQQFGFKLKTRRLTTSEILHSHERGFLPWVRTPNQRPQHLTSPPSASRRTNLPSPSQRMQEQTIAGYVTSIVTQPVISRQLVKIQLSGERMLDSYREKMYHAASRKAPEYQASPRGAAAGAKRLQELHEFAAIASEMSTVMDRES